MILKKASNPYSLSVLFITIAIIFYFVVFHLPSNLFSYDVLGYYLYLPTAFNNGDLTIHNYEQLENVLKQYHVADGFYQAFKVENGNWVMKYPMGLAVLYFPFYLIGDLFAQALDMPTDGFSMPYQLSVLFGCGIYTIVGLAAFQKILLVFFTDKVTALVLFFIIFGTNYFFHVALHGQGAMSHNILFSLHALTVLLTIKWHKTPRIRYAIGMGITIGLSVICRPTEILIILFPVLFNVYSKESLKEKWNLIKLNKSHVYISGFIILSIISYQLFYWKIVTGKFLFDSYSSNPGEGFNFLHPYILEFLFSFRKGWFIYTPIMIFSIIGFWFLYKRNKTLFYPSIIYFALSFYIMSSWSCWWYGISFSSRAIIPCYLILSIPFGYFLSSVLSSKMKFVVWPVMLFLLGLNIFQSWQSSNGILDGSTMTKAFYKSVFLQTTPITQEQRNLLLIDKYLPTTDDFKTEDQGKYKVVYQAEKNFETDLENKQNYIDTISYSKNHCVLTNAMYPFGPDIAKPYKEITSKSYLWLKASVKILTFDDPANIEAGLVLTMRHKGKVYKFKMLDIRKTGLKKGEWGEQQMYYMTPDFWDKRDEIQTFFWNLSDKNVFIDDLKIEAMEPLTDESVF